ncbi:MAG: carboxypeptidase regulatory-like domain-containing protein [bacterium]
MQRLPRFATLTAIALMVLSCTEAPTDSGSAIETGRIGIAPSFSAAATLAYGALAASGVEVTTVRVRLVAPDGSTRDTSIAFPTGMSELQLDLAVPLSAAGQSFRADLELLNSEGVVLFSGSQVVVARLPNIPGSVPAIIQINYTGPGALAKSVAISPPAGVVAGAAALPVSATATNATGASVSDLLVRWTTSDATLATVTPGGSASATVTGTGKRGSVTISAITPLGVTGSAAIMVAPAASKIVVIGGGAQTGVTNSVAAKPMVIEVQAPDNLPVPNTPITFRAVTLGGEVTTVAATTDASGRASTTFSFGPTAGVYVFEAASPSVAPVTISATASAGVGELLSIVSGNFQAGSVASTLQQPLVVKVVDKSGNPVSGATIKWATTLGGGAPTTSTTTTIANGTSSNTYTLGTQVMTEDVHASLLGVPPPGGDIVFNVGASALDPDALAGTGSGQHASVGAALSHPLVVNVTDRYGNPVLGASIQWSVKANSVASAALGSATSVTDVNGNASTLVTLGNTAGPLVVTAKVGPLTFDFSATADPVANVGSGSLSGFVFDGETNAPISGATVTVLLGTQTIAIGTTSAGKYVIPVLPAGTYSVRITAAGYEPFKIFLVTVQGSTQLPAAPMVSSSVPPTDPKHERPKEHPPTPPAEHKPETKP